MNSDYSKTLKRMTRICDQFETSWKSGHPPDLAQFCQRVPQTDRRRLLIELIILDLYYRWHSHADLAAEALSSDNCLPTRPSLDDYVNCFPELGPTSELPMELVCEEYRVRRQCGELIDREHFVARFQRDDLPEALNAIDDELSSQQATGFETLGWVNTTSEMQQLRHELHACGSKIGKYLVVGWLGGGGESDVYQVIHPTLKTPMVAKIGSQRLISAGDDCAFSRMASEGKILANIEHPNMARVYDLDLHDGRPFLIMEQVRGKNLRQFALSRWPSASEAGGIIAKLCQPLSLVHSQGVVHRDIKPENILIDEKGEPRIIDFGLAIYSHPWNTEPIGNESISGTVQFMSPEQAQGKNQSVNEQSDIFGLGAVLYWLLTKQPPFDGQDIKATLRLASECDFDRTALENCAAPSSLKCICLKAMSPKQVDRYLDAREFAIQLEKATAPRNWRKLAAGSFLLCAGLGILCMWLLALTSPSDAVRRDSTALHPKLEVTIWRAGRQSDLRNAVPLKSGDEIRIDFTAAKDITYELFWLDTNGVLSKPEIQTRVNGDNAAFASPGFGSAFILEGPAGTEVVFVCAAKKNHPDSPPMEYLLSDLDPWPPLPPFSFVNFNGDTIDRMQARGPGKIRTIDEETVASIAKTLCERLTAEYEIVSGIAFPHVSGVAEQSQRKSLATSVSD